MLTGILVSVVIIINVFSIAIWSYKDKLKERSFWGLQITYIIILSKPFFIINNSIGDKNSKEISLIVKALSNFFVSNNEFIGIIGFSSSILLTFYFFILGGNTFKSYIMNLIIGKNVIISGFIFIGLSLLFDVNQIFLYGVVLYMNYKIIRGIGWYSLISEDEKLIKNFKKVVKLYWGGKNININKSRDLYKQIKENLFISVRNNDLKETQKYMKLLNVLLDEDIEQLKKKERKKKEEETSYSKDHKDIKRLYCELSKSKDIFLINEVSKLHYKYADYYKKIGESDYYYFSLTCLVEIYEAYRLLTELDKRQINLNLVRGFRYDISDEIFYDGIESYNEENLKFIISTYKSLFYLLERVSYYEDDEWFKIYLSFIDIDKKSIGKANIKYYQVTLGTYLHILIMINENKINKKYKELVMEKINNLIRNAQFKEEKSFIFDSIDFIDKNNIFEEFGMERVYLNNNSIETQMIPYTLDSDIAKILVDLLNKNDDFYNESNILEFFMKKLFRYEELEEEMNEKLKKIFNEAKEKKKEQESYEMKSIKVEEYKDKVYEKLNELYEKESFYKKLDKPKFKISDENMKCIDILATKDLLKDDLNRFIEDYHKLVLKNIKEVFFKEITNQTIEKEKIIKESKLKKDKNKYFIFACGKDSFTLDSSVKKSIINIPKAINGIFILEKKCLEEVSFLKPKEEYLEQKNIYNIFLEEAIIAEKTKKISYQKVENKEELNAKFEFLLVWGIKISVKKDSVLFKIKLTD